MSKCPVCKVDAPEDAACSVCGAIKNVFATVEDTYENEGPKCPYCGRQYTADEGHYFDEQNYTEETCDNCGLTFDVDVYTSTTWTCSPRASAIEARRAETQGVSVADESAVANGETPQPNPSGHLLHKRSD